MSLSEKSAKIPIYGLFIQREGKSVCETKKYKEFSCGLDFYNDVIKQKAKVKEYR